MGKKSEHVEKTRHFSVCLSTTIVVWHVLFIGHYVTKAESGWVYGKIGEPPIVP